MYLSVRQGCRGSETGSCIRGRCQLRQLESYARQTTIICYTWPRPPEWTLNNITAIGSFYFIMPEFYANQQMILKGKLNVKTLATPSFPLEKVRGG
jgi:hypothetical protein